uniref:Ribosome biogenesis protein NOP53 n=1 Tax=Gadus morhua TaxID=8049 RepID=A0A8C5CJ42_GADMO
MAPNRRVKRVAASQPGFMTLNTSIKPENLVSNRRKRINKNKKKNWNKHIDVNDVEDFLEDVRLQERTTGVASTTPNTRAIMSNTRAIMSYTRATISTTRAITLCSLCWPLLDSTRNNQQRRGLISDKSDESLFFLDAGDKKAGTQTVVEPTGRRKASRPLKVDLILKNNSLVPVPKDILAYQLPNAKKLRNVAKKAEQLAAIGKVPKKHRPPTKVDGPTKTTAADAPNNPTRDFYDIWGQETKETRDPWYLRQTGKAPVKALLLKAHEVEVKKEKEENKIIKQLAYDKDDRATEESVFQEQVEGLEEEDYDANDFNSACTLGILNLVEKKTEKQRKKERVQKIKEQRRLASRYKTGQQQQLFQLRSIKVSLRQREQRTKERQTQRRANQEAEKYRPRRLGKLKFTAQDLEVQLTNELTGSLRTLKPEGSVLKDRFKSLQKRNLIEPRERAKFKRRLKIKYVEKRSFREIT